MSRHPRADIYRAEREKGLTYRQIAEKHGVSFQTVAQACGKSDASKFRAFTESDCVYPNLRKWLNDNKVSRYEFIRRVGLCADSATSCTFGKYFRGKHYPNKQTIDKMLRVTGLTYEELFYREDAEGMADG